MCIGASFPKNTFASWRICVVCRVSESTMYYPYLRCPTHIYTLVGYIYTCIGASFHDTRLRLERHMWCAGFQNPLCIIHNSDVLHIYVYVGYIYTCVGASFHDTRLRLKGYVLYATHIQAWRTRGVYKTISRNVMYTTYILQVVLTCVVYNICPCIHMQHILTTHMTYLACRASQSPMYYPYFRCATFVYIYVGNMYTCIGASVHENSYYTAQNPTVVFVYVFLVSWIPEQGTGNYCLGLAESLSYGPQNPKLVSACV